MRRVGLGARYGVKIRKRVAEIKKRFVCPSCGRKSLRRSSAGVWICKNCGLKKSGGAYSP